MTLRTCKLLDCKNKHHARGYCPTHYTSWYRDNLAKSCKLDGCASIRKEKYGLCFKHGYRMRYYGDPYYVRIKQNTLKCSILECDRLSYTRGYCSYHYAQWFRDNLAKPCKVDGCNSPNVGAKGFCPKHWWRVKHHGDPHYIRIRQLICSIQGCNEKYKARGFCSSHYEKWRRFGNPLKQTQYQSREGVCDIPNCNKEIIGRRLCINHYDIWYTYRINPLIPPTCYLCGKKFEYWNSKEVHVDHIIPRGRPKSEELSNFKPACKKCNHSKHDKNLTELIEWCQIIIRRFEEGHFRNINN